MSGDDAGAAEFLNAMAEAELGQHFVGVLTEVGGEAGEGGRCAVEVGGVARETCQANGRVLELGEHSDRPGLGVVHDLGGREHHCKSPRSRSKRALASALGGVGGHGVAHVQNRFEHVAVLPPLADGGDAGIVEAFDTPRALRMPPAKSASVVGTAMPPPPPTQIEEAHGLKAGVEARGTAIRRDRGRGTSLPADSAHRNDTHASFHTHPRGAAAAATWQPRKAAAAMAWQRIEGDCCCRPQF